MVTALSSALWVCDPSGMGHIYILIFHENNMTLQLQAETMIWKTLPHTKPYRISQSVYRLFMIIITKVQYAMKLYSEF